MELTNLTIQETRDGLEGKRFSAREVLDAYLARARSHDKRIGAFLELYEDEATHAASVTDGKIATGGPLRSLEGVPIALKDNMLDAGHAVTAASRILEGYRSSYTATAVARLRDAGAVVVGRTNMDEFAMGSSTESSAWQKTANPWDLSRVPGGSSGGSAAAVAADLAAGAIGSDTGGSIRQPAALCGVVGMKPTYGRVSRAGLIAMASSLDQIGPLAKTVEDASLLHDAMAGRDPLDATTVDAPAVSWKRRKDLKGVRVGIPKEYIDGIASLPMGPAVDSALGTLRDLGAEFVPVSLPNAEYALAVYYVLMPAEVSANLSRFDGIRFGPRAKAGSLIEMYRATRGSLLGDEARRRIMLGTYVLSAGYYDAYYRRAQEARTLVKRDFAEAFKDVDILATPTSPMTAWKLGEKLDDPLAMYLADVDTVSVNVAGLPAISIPSGLLDGLPVGLQFIAPSWGEGRLFEVAECSERAFDFRHKHTPSLKGA